MFCIYCGSKVRDDAVFCTNCGTRFGDAAAPATPEPAAASIMPDQPPMPEQPPEYTPPQYPPQEYAQPEYAPQQEYTPPPEYALQQEYTPPPEYAPQYAQPEYAPPPEETPQYVPPPEQPPTEIPVQYDAQSASYEYPQPPQYYPSPPQYPPQPGSPAGGRQSKSKLALILGIAGGAVLLIGVIFVLLLTGVFGGGSDKPEADVDPEPLVTVAPNPPETPEPSPTKEPTPTEEPSPTEKPDSTEQPDSTPAPVSDSDFDGLAGRWEFDSGVLIWFFGTSEYIEFEAHGDGTGTVFESADEESGTWHIDEDGNFIIEADWSGTYTFELVLSEDTLTLIDKDGDSRLYKRAG